ncbi:radical SAM protein [Streptomyces sp. SCSIO ZS0520]|uniref:radical SAM protein n=1 Tax=Streptomyces sp. SCSIO ZS0520 TaxID=2892996 RepID=UPI0021D80AF8|nr:radical SAM protein [Streptomyces sp. SCSIO ZS0520]
MTGIDHIETLYLQLLFRCNFDCAHCFHGERLAWRDAYTYEQAQHLLALMKTDYQTSRVVLLGGEPLLHTRLPDLVRHARHDLGLRVEICTNGYRIERRLGQCADAIDLLRVSLEGLEVANDRIRRPGSFAAAMHTLAVARNLGIATGATMTVTRDTVDDVLPLARLLQEAGVGQLKLHCLRPVGNAVHHPELTVTEPTAYTGMLVEVKTAGLTIDIVADEDLVAAEPGCAVLDRGGRIQRIESDPRGALTMSCKAVGKDAHAFWYDKAAGAIVHRPTVTDELTLPVADVVYTHV